MATGLTTGLASIGGQAGCSHAPPPPPAPPCTTPEPLRVQLRASARLNPGEKGEALATVVRVYQLKGIGKLTGASFDDLLDRDKDTFGEDLLVVQELTVNPGDLIGPPVGRHADANYVVGVALFRQPVGTNWRVVKKLPPANADHCHTGSKGAPAPDNTTRLFLDENRIELR